MSEPGAGTSAGTDELRLRARVEALERETRRAFEEAQREADTLFAQYQLSQLLASGGTTGQLGATVIVELVRLAGATAGAIWLGEVGRGDLGRVAVAGTFAVEPPERVAGVDAVRTWAAGQGATVLLLGDEPEASVVALRPGVGGLGPDGVDPDGLARDGLGRGGVGPDGLVRDGLDPDGLRIIQLARHEIATAFGGARLRERLEQERSELSAVVEGATDVIVQVDGERRVTRLNPAGEAKLGVDTGALGGRRCDELLGCEAVGNHQGERCPFDEVLATRAPIDYREGTIRGGDGTAIRIAGSYFRAPGEGADIRATGILRDVSAVRALEALREGFVATVSHELRTPLALVQGYAESVLHLELDPEEQRAFVARIHQVAGRLSDLVAEILDVTHLDADPLILERAPASLAALVARLRGDLALSGDDARLVVDLPPDLPSILVDVGRVGRVLENLVGNALKYAPAATPVIVGAAPDGDWLVVTVDDEGIGIPESERALVSEPFHRAWNVRESRIPGTGLGLYICRRLVEAHGGRLSIGDRPGAAGGTRVTFTLPLLADARRRVAVGGRGAAAASGAGSGPAGGVRHG